MLVPSHVHADGEAAVSAGRQREGESVRHRTDSSASGAPDPDQRDHPRDGNAF